MWWSVKKYARNTYLVFSPFRDLSRWWDSFKHFKYLSGLNPKWLMPILKACFISILFLGFVVLFCCEIQCAVWLQKGHASILIFSWAFLTRVLFSLHLYSTEFPCLFLLWQLRGYESINTKLLNLMTRTVVYQKLKYQCKRPVLLVS